MNGPPRRGGDRRPPAAKRIRTDQVRYPGLDPSTLPPDVPIGPTAEGERGEPTRFGEVRDAGFYLGEGRRQRAQKDRRRTRRQRTVVFVVIAAFVAVAAVGAVSRIDDAIRLGQRRAWRAVFFAPSTNENRTAFAGPKNSLRPQPSPTFASFRSVQLHLPVSATDLTELGFHQAAYAYAFRLKTFLKDADLGKASKKRGTGRSPDTNAGRDGRLTGRVLRFWRAGRPGGPDTAVDVGALAGTPVLSPVDGTVLKVKRYLLYGKYDDVQVHIRPDGQSDVDVVLIHLDGVPVKAGDRVEAGITQVGRVRRLSNQMTLELGGYTSGPGDHTHLQLNNLKNPSYKGLQDE